MKKSLILLAFVTGCGASDQGGESMANRGASAPPPAMVSSMRPSSESLTGLYEGGDSAAPSQLCVIETKSEAHFGLMLWGAQLSACSGAGIVEREGERLHLRMTGEQACTIDAAMRNGTITLEGPVPAGCAYYCSARASFEGAAFARKGAALADAMKAKDPAGDALCSN